MPKEKLLYLCHRIPYPPNKGDKIRSFNLLKALSEQYEVHLGCFVDDDFDYQYIDKLADWCVDYKCRPQKKWRAKLKGLTAFLTGKPITLPYYADVQLQRWVDRTLAQYKIDKVFVFSSSMAQFVDDPKYVNLFRVIDFVDVDSDKWRQYADNHRGLMRWVYQREAKMLAQYEQQYCSRFDHSLFVSPDEASLFTKQVPAELAPKIKPLLNGVDTHFFDPNLADEPTGYDLSKPYIVFTGAMDYWANVDAVVWFSQNVWPQIRAIDPALQFFIVGGNPSHEVKQISQQPGIIVTGRVEDVRPFIHRSKFVVAPVRIARGIQNKVLEAMALNKMVVATAMAMEGINAPTSEYLCQTDDAAQFTDYCLQMLHQDASACHNRQWILDNFTWSATLEPLIPLLRRD